VPRSRFYKRKKRPPKPVQGVRAQALSAEHRDEIRVILNSERFMDLPPRQIYATLLDEGVYLCHWRTMYRILQAHGEVKERRMQRKHPVYKKPE
jgi:putative transposase